MYHVVLTNLGKRGGMVGRRLKGKQRKTKVELMRHFLTSGAVRLVKAIRCCRGFDGTSEGEILREMSRLTLAPETLWRA